MDLEIISNRATTSHCHPPIVLIHGAWHGAWCWEGNFLDYLPAKGWDTYAVSLRGHGKSGGVSQLRWASISDYVEDLAQVVSSLDRTPILIGHSMGGFVVQKYLEEHTVPGGLLLASVPPSGTLRFNLRILRRHALAWLTANLLMSSYPIVKTPELAREWFFSADISDEALRKHHAKLQDESYRAALDMLALNLPKPDRVTSPIAVLGGELDRCFSVSEVEATARTYGVEPKIFPAMAHNMMCEKGWESVANWIISWARMVSSQVAQAPRA